MHYTEILLQAEVKKVMLLVEKSTSVVQVQ